MLYDTFLTLSAVLLGSWTLRSTYFGVFWVNFATVSPFEQVSHCVGPHETGRFLRFRGSLAGLVTGFWSDSYHSQLL